jgi:hypothetical protein
MTTSAGINSIVGYPFAGNANNTTNGGLAVEVATATSGYVPLIPVGTITSVVDPYWGGLELIRLAIPTSTTAIVAGTLAVWDSSYQYVIAPNTANMGQSLGVSMSAIPLNATYVQYAWFVIGGKCPVLCGASVAADTAFGITAAGKDGANSAGKQILNARVRTAATATVAKANTTTQSGSPVIKVANTDGWFVGVVLSGTGITGGTTVTGIDVDNRSVTMSANATASGSVTVTGTYNDGSANYWNTAILNRPFAQGQIV